MSIAINGLSKVIKGVPVLRDINMSLESGRIYGLKGPNGSGKTMLMRAICGLIRPTEGEVTVGNQIIGRDISFPPSIGVLIENPSFIAKYTGLRNLELLAMIQDIIGIDDIRKALTDVGLDPDDRRVYRKYSLGMKQRLGIAAALMENPEILLLDEPTNALDESGIAQIRELLLSYKKAGSLIVVSCHDSDELELLSDEVFEMYEGRITNHRILTQGAKNEKD
jgi:ABC-2 type transport system ATP-binding protein